MAVINLAKRYPVHSRYSSFKKGSKIIDYQHKRFGFTLDQSLIPQQVNVNDYLTLQFLKSGKESPRSLWNHINKRKTLQSIYLHIRTGACLLIVYLNSWLSFTWRTIFQHHRCQTNTDASRYFTRTFVTISEAFFLNNGSNK